mmetsp:Transcript_16051/g.35727  ORF Transcript_16051/g.35727 Transcript_16051/m.35727 type:complete len:610 (-) Transcript_16051:63-1892(-)
MPPSPSSASWYRVARGVQLVAESALQQASSAAGTSSARYAEHAADLARNARVASARASDAVNGESLSNAWIDTTDKPSAFTPEPSDLITNEALQEAERKNPSIETPTEYNMKAEENVIPIHTSSGNSEQHSAAGVAATTYDPYKHIDDAPTLEEGQPVPSTRVGRAFGFASLGVGLAAGTVAEAASRILGSNTNNEHSYVTSDANADRLASHLCRMRGAALKLGQMLSMQDEAFLAPPLARALARVRGSADAMPKYQLDSVLMQELGPEWREKLKDFEDLPFAAASIGQVHRGAVEGNHSSRENGQLNWVALKVQYPGVAESIDSDLNNLTMLVKATGLAPPGLFIDEVIRVGREELRVECDYVREAENQTRFRKLLLSDDVLSGPECKLSVPRVIPELSTKRVLTTEMAPGGTIDKVSNLDQEERNRIGRAILRLTMKELFVWRFMQTDPNWGNFLYDVGTGTTHLIDFGAAREFSKEFVDGYLQIVKSSADEDVETLMDVSHQMGFLTGEENQIMLEAHKMSGFTVGEPFATDEAYDFGRSGISARLSSHSSAFLQHRLIPPPPEVYTLHRKLAGAYNLCIKLGSIIPCRDLLDEVVEDYVFGHVSN